MVTPKKKEKSPVKEAKGLAFSGTYHYANGKRKTSIARVRLYEKGQGRIIINDKPFKEYLTIKETYGIVEEPLRLTNGLKDFDISVSVMGGGTHAQAEAIRHGIAKALQIYNPELRATLKKMGLLTRDDREKERKKYGLKRARRAPQFSKR